MSFEHTIAIQKRMGIVKDPNNKDVMSWSGYIKTYADIKQLSKGDFYTLGGDLENITFKFEIQKIEEICTLNNYDHRMVTVEDNRIWHIIFVDPYTARDRNIVNIYATRLNN